MSENRLDFILAYHRKHPWRYEMSKKSKWKTGKEIIDEEGIKEIEFSMIMFEKVFNRTIS